MRTTVELPGLLAHSPIGFMAALGLLRVLSEDHRLDVRLGWRGGHAVLQGIDRGELIQVLQTHMAGRHRAPEWNWRDTTKRVTPEEFQGALASMAGDARARSFLAGFVLPAILDGNGFLSSTRLDMTSGRQQLLADLRRLAEALQEPGAARRAFQRALFGGPYEAQSSYGWDPAAVRRHALEAKAPTTSKPPGKPGLVWLAAESLAWHPMRPWDGRAYTTGCERLGGDWVYFWPIWSGCLDAVTARTLRQLSHDQVRRLPGVTACWASTFDSSGQYGALLPARPLS